ncbi:putative lyase domain protein [Yersinia pestis PY-71]|nr:putative lyase domain protein [Yersinia pestis PY-71]EIS88292.1 putative lyase domain protein [Yersinia pestis PY-88]EIT39396.1 cysteine synthase/cystathionine beta-synthase family protein [Yersinia pestis PY-99]
MQLAKQMREQGKSGAIVTLLCDSGERYLDTYYNEEWVSNNIGDLTPFTNELNNL